MNIHADAQQAEFIREELRPLVGGTIAAVSATLMDGGYAPVLTIDTKYGQRVTAEVWTDEEGNGPGALAFTSAKARKVIHSREQDLATLLARVAASAPFDSSFPSDLRRRIRVALAVK